MKKENSKILLCFLFGLGCLRIACVKLNTLHKANVQLKRKLFPKRLVYYITYI